MWFGAVALLASANVAHALYFDWSDVDFHIALSMVCVVVALRWPRVAAASAGSVVVAVIAASLLRAEPAEWARLRIGDDWKEVQRALGPPTYEAANLAQARRLEIGYSRPSPLRLRQGGAVAIYLRGEYALWVVHDGNVVKGTFIGGS
jgi:hypothetical protein